MARFPIEYEVVVEKGAHAPLEVRAGHRPRIDAGAPPDFGGTDAWWSPEHLLVSAVATCYGATFFAGAERAGLRIGAYRCVAEGTLDRTAGGVAFASVRLALAVRVVADDAERARRLALETKERCFVARSLACPVTVSVDVTAS